MTEIQPLDIIDVVAGALDGAGIPSGRKEERGLRVRRIVAYVVVAALGWSVSAMAGIDVYFSPRGGATEAVVAQLANAKFDVLVRSRNVAEC